MQKSRFFGKIDGLPKPPEGIFPITKTTWREKSEKAPYIISGTMHSMVVCVCMNVTNLIHDIMDQTLNCSHAAMYKSEVCWEFHPRFEKNPQDSFYSIFVINCSKVLFECF